MDTDELLGYVISSNRRRQVLKELQNRAMRPMELSNKLKLDTGNMARILFQLEKNGLIKCITPDKKSWRVYKITDTGEKIISSL